MTDAWKQWEGEVIDGRFRLLQFLGGSDHSAVFLAEAGAPAHKVALKFVDANPATAQLQLSRWERAAKLSHRHLLQILQSGRCQLGRATMLYVVSEFAQENLSQILPNRPLNQTEAEYMLRSVLEVLAYLHGQGLAHGRLKPGNILAVSEELKVSGDSISRPGERPLGQAQPTVYDPPEITTSGLSPAGDVWSLGVTLVEVLTQHASVGDGIRQGDLALPESLPAPFLEIARQCLRLDPQRRWTVPDIAARLLPPSAPPKQKTSLTQTTICKALPVASRRLLSRKPRKIQKISLRLHRLTRMRRRIPRSQMPQTTGLEPLFLRHHLRYRAPLWRKCRARSLNNICRPFRGSRATQSPEKSELE
jgi:serine/threonine-protein kinase Stk1